jgi:hypothetical protein
MSHLVPKNQGASLSVTLAVWAILGFLSATNPAPAQTAEMDGGSVHGGIYTLAIDGKIGTLVDESVARAAGSKVQRIDLPQFEVFLMDVDANRRVAGTRTDLLGRYYFRNQPAGTYKLCWNSPGWIPGCADRIFQIKANIVYMAPQEVRPRTIRIRNGSTRGAIWGIVRLADRSSPWFTEQFFDVHRTGRVTVTNHGGAVLGRAVTNALGEFVIVDVPIGSLRADALLYGAQGTAIVSAAAASSGMPLALVLRNRRPIVFSIVARSGGQARREVSAGAALDVTAEVRDVDGDRLTYTWKPAPDAGRIVSSDGPNAVWELDAGPGLKQLYLLVSDEKGGLTTRSVIVNAGAAEAVFSGRVVNAAGGAIPKATVVVNNGQPIVTDSAGSFFVKAPLSSRYVLNISALGFVPASKVYDRSGTYQVYRLAPAFVTDVDFGRTNTLVDARRVGEPNARRGSVKIEPGTLVGPNAERSTGPLTAQLATIDITKGEMPGDYGARSANRETNLISYGALHIEFRDSAGNVQQLARGATAEVTIPIPAAMKNPPKTIALWSYNEKTGYWDDLGDKATLDIARRAYVGKVRHLSTINTDIAYSNASCLRILLENADRAQLIASVTSSGFAQNPQLPLGDALNAIFRLPANTNVLISVLDANTHAPITGAEIYTYDTAAGQVLSPTGVVNTGPASTPLFPPIPYSNCQTVSVRLPVPLVAATSHFLKYYYGHGSLPSTITYYQGLDPVMTWNGTAWSGGNHSTLGAWWALAGFNTNPSISNGTFPDEASAAYLNYNDLGFGREMHIRRNTTTGDIFAYVTNYGDHNQNPANADLAQQALTTGTRPTSLATVAMEWSDLPGLPSANSRAVKFFVFGGSDATSPLINSADLDGFGQVFVPQLCQICHGGNPYGGTSSVQDLSLRPALTATVGASFREFDTKSFRYPSGVTAIPSGMVPVFKALNDLVNATGPQPPIAELITGWHSGTSPFQTFTPPGWSATPVVEGLYQDIVAKSCRTCHGAFHDNTASGGNQYDLTWRTYEQFLNSKGSIGYRVCNNSGVTMPHALITYRNFWLDAPPHSPTVLGAFTSPAVGSIPAWTPIGTCQ